MLAVLLTEIPANALRAFPEFFQNFFRKVPAVLGVWPKEHSLWLMMIASFWPKEVAPALGVGCVVVIPHWRRLVFPCLSRGSLQLPCGTMLHEVTPHLKTLYSVPEGDDDHDYDHACPHEELYTYNAGLQ